MNFIAAAKFLAPLIVLVSLTSPAAAQEPTCERSEVSDPPRVIYHCANGLVLEAEAATELGIAQAPEETRPGSATVSDKAVLIEVEPGSGDFQILTPHAIAAVRGTAYIVDVSTDTTAVFVIRGKVAVSLPDGSQTVVLGPGEGADAIDGEELQAKVWGQARASALLARFAR